MRRLALTLLLIAALPLSAADVEVGVHHLGAIMTGKTNVPGGGTLDIGESRGFGATAELFWSPRISTQFAATFLNPVAILEPIDLDLNTIGIDIYSADVRYHFAPERRWSAFVGAGGAVVSLGNLEDRFADNVELRFDPQTTFLAETGVRFRVRPRIVVDANLTYVALEADARVVRNNNGIAVPSQIRLNPVTVSLGATWRF
ncbi:MAG: outer membrane beta-barrel protein [Acidobacteriota bacterium]|nr:outer membrane beta-barrel protein [Acidobacteriota bacterium]